MERHIYYIKGLGCANCALKIEDSLNKLEYVDNAIVDFSNSKLIISYDDKHLKEIEKIADKIEPGIKFEKEKVEHHHEFTLKNLYTIIISLILVGLTFLLKMDEQIKLIIYLIAYLIVAYDILIKLVKNIINRQLLDENFLMGIATIAAFAIGDYIEAIAIIIFYKVGELFQEMAVNKSRKSITSLIDIQPKTANLLVDNKETKTASKDVSINSLILVKPGERIPLDGIIEDGKSYLDMKELTGESLDVKVDVGDEVLSGSINKSSTLIIKTTKKYEDSTASRILNLVENSSSNKAKTENFISKFARVYTPIIVFVSIMVAILPPLITGESFYDWLYKALIFLVLACPCALVISIPLGFFGGIGNASKNGILIKGANYLEALNDIDIVAFDKTGTLTKGNFTLINIKAYNNYTNDYLLKMSAYIESNSNHPISKAIIDAYDYEIEKNNIEEYHEIAGLGLKAIIDKQEVLVGNEKLMKENNIAYEIYLGRGSIVYVAINKIYAGYLEIADEIKDSSAKAIQDLKEQGIKEVIVLSGDNQQVVKSVAEELKIDKYYAQLLPDQKVEHLNEIKKQGKCIFVGDGINDAPILLQADVGIAMGGVGSDVAIEAADIVIMDDEISKVGKAIKISKKTKRIVIENIIIALVVKVLVLILGILGMAQIWEAVIADVGVALIAILNTTRILYYKVDKNGK